MLSFKVFSSEDEIWFLAWPRVLLTIFQEIKDTKLDNVELWEPTDRLTNQTQYGKIVFEVALISNFFDIKYVIELLKNVLTK